MTKQITLEEALKLVEFEFVAGAWRVRHVKTSVYGSVWCNVIGDIDGSVGSVIGDVMSSVYGNVGGTINGREWQFVENPKDKLKRLIDEGADKDQLLKAFNQLEENSD
jgi:hypothetical protein